jgi:hypothetical protein
MKKISILILLLGQLALTFGQTQTFSNFDSVEPHLIKALECRNWSDADASSGLNVKTLPISHLNLSNIPGVTFRYESKKIIINFPKNILVMGKYIDSVGLVSYDDSLIQIVRINSDDAKSLAQKAANTIGGNFSAANVNTYQHNISDGHNIIIFPDEKIKDYIYYSCNINSGAKGILVNSENKSDIYENIEQYNIAKEKIKKDQLEKIEQERLKKEKEAKDAIEAKEKSEKDMQILISYENDINLYYQKNSISTNCIWWHFIYCKWAFNL